MANITASTGLRDIIAANLAACYYWVTLHNATGSTLAMTDVYSAGIKGELATANGYTQGGVAMTLTSSLLSTARVLDSADKTWTGTGTTGIVAQYSAVWMSTANNIIGASLLCVTDSSATPQTANNGGTMTAGIANPISIPLPA
jgi:hypothetical protein